MRDLQTRLREIVRRPATSLPPASRGELTYVPEPDPVRPLEQAAARLGGVATGPNGALVEIDRLYPDHRSHGRQPIEAFTPRSERPLHLLDGRFRDLPEWWRRVIFFDIETTGLSGGAGTLPFLVGCGWFGDEGFVVRQFFLAAPSGERAMLDRLTDLLGGASLLVTYNGRAFDVPLMETRWAFHRTAAPTDDLPHFDMLPPARRLWSQRESRDGQSGCSLGGLERDVLGFHRHADVPGFEIPVRYFQFLRSGDASIIDGVLEHNRHDLVSLAGVMGHALWLAQEGPDACREPGECLAVGRLYERAGAVDRAEHAFDRAKTTGDSGVRRAALARLAAIFKRSGRQEDAVRAWEEILALGRGTRATGSSLDRDAAEALAIHHEHRAKDLVSARRYAMALGGDASGRRRSDIDHRLARLERKLRKTTGLEF